MNYGQIKNGKGNKQEKNKSYFENVCVYVCVCVCVCVSVIEAQLEAVKQTKIRKLEKTIYLIKKWESILQIEKRYI